MAGLLERAFNSAPGKAMAGRLGLAEPPRLRRGRQLPDGPVVLASLGGSDLAVFKKSTNRDSAWKFVQWLSDPKVQVKWYSLSTDLPSVKSAWTDPALAADPKLAVFGKQLEDAKAPPATATWEQVAAAFDTEMEKVAKSGLDPAAALKTVQSKADSIGTGN